MILISVCIFKGSPTSTATPCPGEIALQGGKCPEFDCNAVADACKNEGTCDNDGSCSCKSEFKWIDCSLGKIIQGFAIDQSFKCFWPVYFQLAFT